MLAFVSFVEFPDDGTAKDRLILPGAIDAAIYGRSSRIIGSPNRKFGGRRRMEEYEGTSTY